MLAAIGKKSAKYLQVPVVSTRRITRTRQRQLDEAAAAGKAIHTAESDGDGNDNDSDGDDNSASDDDDGDGGAEGAPATGTATAVATTPAATASATPTQGVDGQAPTQSPSPSPAKPPRRRTRASTAMAAVGTGDKGPPKPQRGKKSTGGVPSAVRAAGTRKRSFASTTELGSTASTPASSARGRSGGSSLAANSAADKENGDGVGSAAPMSAKKKRKLFKKGAKDPSAVVNPEDAPTPSRLRKGLSAFGKKLMPRRKKTSAP
jgi:hypothetical protein